MAHIITDDERKRMAEREKEKLQQEINERKKELGIREMTAMKGQDERQQIEDLKNEANHIKEDFARASEERAAASARKRKSEIESRPAGWGEERYFKMKEAREKEEYEKRKIRL